MSRSSIRIPAREIPVLGEAEVLVVGAGPGGLAAAIGAGRTGADVLLLERFGYVGGQATGGLRLSMPPARWLGVEDPSVTIEPPGMVGTITNEIHDRLLAIAGGRTGTEAENWRSMWYPEELKWLGLQMLEDVGVRPLFHAMAVGALVDEGVMRGVVVETKSGRHAILAHQVVDCSGDADIAAWAGVPFLEGDTRRKMPPVGLAFTIRGVDGESYRAWMRSQGDLPRGQALDLSPVRGDELLGRCDYSGKVNGADPRHLTRAENAARELAMEKLQWLRQNAAGCESAYLALTAPQLAVQSTRLVRGEHVVTDAEMATGMVFRDHIGFVCEGKSVPYRALVPLGVENLLVGGRCISQDHDAVETTSSVPSSMVTGFVAGVAAALAHSAAVTPRSLDMGRLHDRLRDHGVLFPPGEWRSEGWHP